jgi:hypothetical protein
MSVRMVKKVSRRLKSAWLGRKRVRSGVEEEAKSPKMELAWCKNSAGA